MHTSMYLDLQSLKFNICARKCAVITVCVEVVFWGVVQAGMVAISEGTSPRNNNIMSTTMQGIK